MNQGTPTFIGQIQRIHHAQIANALRLHPSDIHDTLPIEVVSTGLNYLLVPLKQGLDRAKISIGSFESFLGQFDAKFVYVFDAESLEGRTWDNNGITEDVATGSAAGPLCAYLVKHELARYEELIHIHQGRFLHRPSIIKAWMTNESGEAQVFISGDVSFFATGEIYLPKN
jgi:PhzF family phenazine biosynthesis protein